MKDLRKGTKGFDKLDTVGGKDPKHLELTDHPYVVYLCNRSNWTATHIKDEQGHYSDLRPPIGRTCNEDQDTCFKNGRYAPLLTVNCSSRAFNIALRVTHPKGQYGDTGSVQIQPDCGYAGEVIYLAIPDPT